VREDGDTVRILVAVPPVPERLTDCGLPVPSLVTVRLAARAPTATGAKATVTVQDRPGVIAAGQVLPVIVKSPGLVPPRAIEEIVVVALPVEVIVTFCPALVDPKFVVAYVSDGGDRLNDLVGGTITSWLMEKLRGRPEESCSVPISPILNRSTLIGTFTATGTLTVAAAAMSPKVSGSVGALKVGVPEPARTCNGMPVIVTPIAGPDPMFVSCSVAE
jgi:hypothetical protein